jgi:hypothetical protein
VSAIIDTRAVKVMASGTAQQSMGHAQVTETG